jgi:CTP:molybdopterin cytidylyltransferase MocA
VLVSLVDLPDIDVAVLRRVAAAGSATSATSAGHVLVRATYDGRPGHPVLIGREHWAGVAATARGDHGARDYLAAHDHVSCECGDLATGRDVDSPPR